MNAHLADLEQRFAAAHPEARSYVVQMAELAEEYAAASDHDRASVLASEALQQARGRAQLGTNSLAGIAFKGEELIAECANAIVFAEHGQFDEALPRFFRIMNQAESQSLSDVQTKAMRWIGVCYLRIAMYTTALEYLTKSRTLAEHIEDSAQESLAYSSIGDVHYGLGDAQTALQCYREALRLAELSPETAPHTKPPILFSIASAYKGLRGQREATVYFEQALTAYKHQQNMRGVCLSLMGVAEMYAHAEPGQERFDKALELLFVALEVSQNQASQRSSTKNIAFTTELAHIHLAIGEVYRRAERYEKALEYLREAERVLHDSQVLGVVAKVHESLTACYKAVGDIPRAFEHLEIFHALREQTTLQDGKQSVRYLQQGFDMERAQKESEIYRLKNVELAHAQQELERLLLNILPSPIAQRLRQGEYRIADSYEAVTVVFVDLVGFTRLATQYSAVHVVAMLDHLFSEIDDLTQTFGLEKIKTIGDAYMAVAGLPFRQPDHILRAAKFALAVQEMMKFLGRQYNVQARIGMHSGAAVAGVIGKTKFVYDLWGDTVNIASRMESHGEAGRIHVSEEIYAALSNSESEISQSIIPQSIITQVTTPFFFEERGEIEVKGKGKMRTWFLMSTNQGLDEAEFDIVNDTDTDLEHG